MKDSIDNGYNSLPSVGKLNKKNQDVGDLFAAEQGKAIFIEDEELRYVSSLEEIFKHEPKVIIVSGESPEELKRPKLDPKTIEPFVLQKIPNLTIEPLFKAENNHGRKYKNIGLLCKTCNASFNYPGRLRSERTNKCYGHR